MNLVMLEVDFNKHNGILLIPYTCAFKLIYVVVQFYPKLQLVSYFSFESQ